MLGFDSTKPAGGLALLQFDKPFKGLVPSQPQEYMQTFVHTSVYSALHVHLLQGIVEGLHKHVGVYHSSLYCSGGINIYAHFRNYCMKINIYQRSVQEYT